MNQSLSKKQRKKLKLKQKQEEAQKQAKEAKNASSFKSQEPKAQHNEKKDQKSHQKRKLSEQKVQNVQKKVKKQKNKKQKKLFNINKQQDQSSDKEQELAYEDIDFNQIQQGLENEQFSFLIAQINEKHYHSMKTILQKFSRITGVMSSEWADAIIGNGKAGNVVVADDEEQEDQEQESEQENQNQQDDEDNVCSGVINILPFNHKLSKKMVEKILKSNENKKYKIQGKPCSQILKNNNCSLLICERAVNLPPFIVQSMHEVLVKDLEQLSKTNKSLYQKICNNYIVGMSEVQIPKQQNRENLNIQQLIYSKFEDYLFVGNSVSWWVGQGSPNSVRKVPLHKLYYIISVKKYFQSVGLIHTLLNQ